MNIFISTHINRLFHFFLFISIFILGFLDDKYSISQDKKLIILFLFVIYVISDSTVGIENIRLNF